MKTIDEQFTDKTVTAVADMAADGSCSITTNDGWSFSVPATPFKVSVGDPIRFYGAGIGFTVRGLTLLPTLNGETIRVVPEVIFYRTGEEEQGRHRKMCEEQSQRRIADYKSTSDERNAKWEALPIEFCERCADFIHRRGMKWRYDFEPYELFVCEQAFAFAAALKTREAIQAFREMPWEKQREVVPAMGDGHSGNTFGAACVLAHLYVTEPALVRKAHGALCPLVGCQEYGCYSTEAP